jgi:hypothetical protein
MSWIPVPRITNEPHRIIASYIEFLIHSSPVVRMWIMRVLLLVALAACSADPLERPATWSYLHPAIVAPSCATSSCHSGLVETAGFAFDDRESSYARLLELRFVVPGDPTSALIPLLEGDERTRMPPDAPLPQADIDLVSRWIEEGAPP